LYGGEGGGEQKAPTPYGPKRTNKEDSYEKTGGTNRGHIKVERGANGTIEGLCDGHAEEHQESRGEQAGHIKEKGTPDRPKEEFRREGKEGKEKSTESPC